MDPHRDAPTVPAAEAVDTSPDTNPDTNPDISPDDTERWPQAEVAARLAAEPDPGAMPPEVEQRVSQALLRAGEIRLHDRELFDELGLEEHSVEEEDEHVIVFPGSPDEDDRTRSTVDARSPFSGTGGTDGTDGHRRFDGLTRRRWPLLAAAAAVIALLAFAGATLFGSTRSDTDGLAALPGAGGASPSSSVATSVAGRLHIQASGVAYTADTLASGARALLTNPGPEVGADQATALGPLATTDGANACVAALGDADAPSVTVDLATFSGQPAAVVVIARDGKTTAYAVQRGCATGDPEVIKDSVPVP